MEERRKFVRLPARLDVTYTVLQGGTAKQTVTKDVGGGGVRLLTDDVLAPGTRLQLVCALPGREQPITCLAEVVWSEPSETVGKTERRRSVETGVRFVEIAARDQDAIMQYVSLNLSS